MKKELDHFKQHISPSKSFVKNLKNNLFFTYTGETKPVHSSFLSFIFFYMKKLGIAILSIVVILGWGLSVYAYESPSVTNGHPLYGLKRTLENAESVFARGDQAQAEYHLKLAMRRVEESQFLEKEGENEQATLKDLDDQVQILMEKINAIQDPVLKAQILQLYKEALAKNLAETKAENIDNADKNKSGTGSTIPSNSNINGYKNRGQEQSDEVNKGQQGERMRNEHAKSDLANSLEQKIKEVEDQEDAQSVKDENKNRNRSENPPANNNNNKKRDTADENKNKQLNTNAPTSREGENNGTENRMNTNTNVNKTADPSSELKEDVNKGEDTPNTSKENGGKDSDTQEKDQGRN